MISNNKTTKKLQEKYLKNEAWSVIQKYKKKLQEKY